MSMDYIRRTYGVPARRGGQVEFNGKLTGIITGSRGPHLRVRFNGRKKSVIVHPAWRITYLPK